MVVTHLEDKRRSVNERVGQVRGHERPGNTVVVDTANFGKRVARARAAPVGGIIRRATRLDGNAVGVITPPAVAEEEAGQRKEDRQRREAARSRSGENGGGSNRA